VDASIGLAEHGEGETMKDLLARADAAMYLRKAAAWVKGGGPRR
jgi:PleD family two-component response regulator